MRFWVFHPLAFSVHIQHHSNFDISASDLLWSNGDDNKFHLISSIFSELCWHFDCNEMQFALAWFDLYRRWCLRVWGTHMLLGKQMVKMKEKKLLATSSSKFYWVSKLTNIPMIFRNCLPSFASSFRIAMTQEKSFNFVNNKESNV